MFLFLPPYLVLSIRPTSLSSPLLLHVGRTSNLLSIQYGRADGISLLWLCYKAKAKGICPCRLRFWFLERERKNGSGRIWAVVSIEMASPPQVSPRGQGKGEAFSGFSFPFPVSSWWGSLRKHRQERTKSLRCRGLHSHTSLQLVFGD